MHPTTAPRRTRLLLGVAALPLVALAACGGAATSTATAPTTARSEPVAAAAPLRDEHVTLVARPAVDTDVFAGPDAAAPTLSLPARNEFGSPLALVVLEDSVPGWLEVQLPVRPNGSTGWIRASGVELREVDLAVHVDLAARRLVVTDSGATVLESSVAVGATSTPTPTGTFFVVDKLDTGRPDGPYGPFAFGLSAHSDVLTEFAGGEGQVGIHGTSDPTSIGNAASNGCVRVPNDVAIALEGLLPLGTPVTIA